MDNLSFFDYALAFLAAGAVTFLVITFVYVLVDAVEDWHERAMIKIRAYKLLKDNQCSEVTKYD